MPQLLIVANMLTSSRGVFRNPDLAASLTELTEDTHWVVLLLPDGVTTARSHPGLFRQAHGVAVLSDTEALGPTHAAYTAGDAPAAAPVLWIQYGNHAATAPEGRRVRTHFIQATPEHGQISKRYGSSQQVLSAIRGAIAEFLIIGEPSEDSHKDRSWP